MKSFLSLFAAATLFLCGQAQITIMNNAHAQKRTLTGFNAIKVSDAIDLLITQGNEASVVVSASDEESRDKIQTAVVDSILEIKTDKTAKAKLWKKDRKLKVYVVVPSLKKIQASGACNVKIEGNLQANNLDIDISGASECKGMLHTNQLKLHLSGASEAVLEGKATSLQVTANGASELKGFDFTTDDADVDASGASDVKVTVNKQVNVAASGASEVRIKGAGVIKTLKSSGSSDIRKM
jgi:hypothetical protein